MATTTLDRLHWAKGDDDDNLVARTEYHELTVYPPTATGRAFWYVTTLTGQALTGHACEHAVAVAGDEVATGFADTLADAKEDAVLAAREDFTYHWEQ